MSSTERANWLWKLDILMLIWQGRRKEKEFYPVRSHVTYLFPLRHHAIGARHEIVQPRLMTLPYGGGGLVWCSSGVFGVRGRGQKLLGGVLHFNVGWRPADDDGWLNKLLYPIKCPSR